MGRWGLSNATVPKGSKQKIKKTQLNYFGHDDKALTKKRPHVPTSPHGSLRTQGKESKIATLAHFGPLSLSFCIASLHCMKESDDYTFALVRKHYPGLTEDEAIETREHLRQYFQIARAIFERLQRDPDLRRKYEDLKREYRLLTATADPASLNAVEKLSPEESLIS